MMKGLVIDLRDGRICHLAPMYYIDFDGAAARGLRYDGKPEDEG